MSSIVIAGDTSGSVTLQAPAVAGTTVITLPSTSTTLVSSQWTTTGNDIYYNTGNVGIGSSSPATKLDFGVTTNGTQIINLRKNGASVAGLGVNAEYGARIAGPYDAAAPVSFGEIGSDGTTFTEKARIVANGIQSVNSISVGNVAPTGSGAGITFPASQSASTSANTLDDYEEGTWTPSFSGTSNLTGTPSISNATYTKTGNRVIWQFQASGYSATSSATLTYFICTFPFTQANIVPGAVIHAPASGVTGSMQANDTSSGYFVWAATSSPASGSVGTLYAFGQSQTT